MKDRVTILSVPSQCSWSLGTLEASLPHDPSLPAPHQGGHPSQTLEWKPAAGMKPGEGQRGTGPASARTSTRAQDSAWETKRRDIFPPGGCRKAPRRASRTHTIAELSGKPLNMELRMSPTPTRPPIFLSPLAHPTTQLSQTLLWGRV